MAIRRRLRWSSIPGPTALVALFAAFAAAAGIDTATPPLDLDDPSPRPIVVRFEISPADQPGRLDAQWSPPRHALLEPAAGDRPEQVRIRIPAREMEAHLRSTGTAVVEGSFSDFVWTLDRRSGEVLAAELAGRIEERVGLGLLSAQVSVEIRVEMSSDRSAGFRTGHQSFGKQTHDLCSPAEHRCIPVEGRPFDAERGYVNAVGAIRAFTPLIEVEAFSPLGEARFSERAVSTLGASSATTTGHEAVFSSESTRGGSDRAGGGHDEKAERPDDRGAGRPS